MTSHTPFFAKPANKSDHSPDAGNMVSTCAENAQVQPASAVVPSEEEIARAIYHGKPRNRPWDILPHEFKNQYRKQARAVLTLFAPILAEKEREYELASEGRAAFAARALAAEAALAAEREKVAQVLEPFDDALGEDDEGYGDGLTVVMKWGACTDYSVTLADLRDVRKLAAAIRAQGE